MDKSFTAHEAGHKFLARLGKKRLRPGGKIATEWLLSQSGLHAESHVLEIACNMGTTAIEIASQFRCHITGIDMDKQALAQAKKNVADHGLTDLITIQMADASKLPFADNSFDVVINEAMLTMYGDKAKTKLLQEYYRVLKPGGRLLTHDIALKDEQDVQQVAAQMQQVIHVKAQPLPQTQWVNLFKQTGFQNVMSITGPMTLLSPKGLIYDEGLLGAMKIIRNALKKENRPQFLQMFRHFRRNRGKFNYVAVVSMK
ncbi:methyltransferase domain-containing protein [Providencia rettgeri]|uniref:class I SAM-dependent methyltransferase n=1 Tax=Providencia TaxID=586 RepID=UPI001CFE0540|nr:MULTISPECIES: class I SAM-dependent methyltransferase [Providencia]EIU7555750.1 methyltransferase domain-containing protein [Providencia rettgeri]EJD6499155.1 methyltransferase domain-containing protein [Providencia rettgeri]EJD6642295.1 methyltransferase domain-containing protein [Providencia rettgeri]ELL9152666.1 methyltransferase domain-containing protein [Providencia rettgeri]ELR5046711.1 methyltransferase domain-containing protein [Providencia rettgeri]